MSAIKKKVLEESEVDKLLIAIDNMNEKDIQKGGWLDVTSEPQNVIERYILKVTKSLGHEDVEGYEWWIHDYGDGKGNNAHYDKNESVFRETGKVFSPKNATVTYLAPCGSPTNICDIKPIANDKSEIVEECNWFIWSYPTEGTIIQFDGNLLHGVPPGDPNQPRITFMINIWDKKEDCDIKNRPDYKDDVDISLLDNEPKHPVGSEANVLYNPGGIYMGGNGGVVDVAYQLLLPQLKDVSTEEDFYIARRTQKVYVSTNEEEFKKYEEILRND